MSNYFNVKICQNQNLRKQVLYAMNMENGEKL